MAIKADDAIVTDVEFTFEGLAKGVEATSEEVEGETADGKEINTI